MAAAKGKRTSKEYETPIKVAGTTKELPPSKHQSPVRDLVNAILENGSDEWTELNSGGRPPSNVQSSLTGAAQRMGVKIETRIRPNDNGDDVVFARKAPGSRKSESGA